MAFASLRFTEIAYVILICSPPTIAAADVLARTRAAAGAHQALLEKIAEQHVLRLGKKTKGEPD